MLPAGPSRTRPAAVVRTAISQDDGKTGSKNAPPDGPEGGKKEQGNEMKRVRKIRCLKLCMAVGLILAVAGTGQAVTTTIVPGESCLTFAGQSQPALENAYAPSNGWELVAWDVGGAGNAGNWYNDTADWEGVVRAYSSATYSNVADRTAASIIPPFMDVTGFAAAGYTLDIAATGLWGRGPSFSYGPDGHSGNMTSDAVYDDFGISTVSAPKAALIGVFLDAATPVYGTAAPSILTAGSSDMTTPLLKQSFFIGSSLDGIAVPTGATRLFFGFHNGHEWWNNDGDMTVSTTVIPEPLTMLGVFAGIAGIGGYIRKRRRA